MLKHVTLALDSVDAASWTQHDVPNICEFLKTQFPVFPDTGRIYHGAVSQENDVTPACEEDIAKLLGMPGPFFVIIYPGWAALPYIFSAVLAVAAYVLAPSPVIPPPLAAARNSQAASPNNELSDRSNRARINGRIPDIFGTVRSTPDLIAAPYKIFENNKEVEYAYMCIGRGEYEVSDIRDGATLCSNIPGTSIAVYGPYTSPNSGDAPQLQIGSPIPHKVLNTKRSNSVNGQVLRPPNAQTLTTLMRFAWPNVIQLPLQTGADFSKGFVEGDTVTLSNAVLTAGGGSTTEETFQVDVHYVDGGASPNAGSLFLTMAIASPNWVVGADMTITDISSTQPGYDTTTDLSGTYEITDVLSLYLGGEYAIPVVVITFESPEVVNSDWALITGQLNKLLTLELSNPTLSFDLDGDYTIVSVTSSEIVLDDPESVAADWANLETPLVSPFLVATLETTESNKWYGPFVLESTDRTSILSNFTAVNGLYKDNGTTQTAASVTVQLEVTPINSLDEPIGNPQVFLLVLEGSDTLKETISKTMTAVTAAVGRVAVRASRVSESDTAFTGTVVDEVRWKDMYAVSPVDKEDFGNVTTVHSITFATASALAVKDRKLNLLATRKIPLRVSGSTFSTELTASDDAAEIFSAICRDQYIGRRTLAEMDFDNIYDTVDAIEAYFGTDKVRKFAYTFDSDNMSFEETATQVADALFCVAYRRGNVIRLSFEKETDDSTLLFNHRNKIPKSERRSVTFGNGHEFDGLEYTYVDPRDDSIISIFLPPDYAATNPKKVESIGIRDHLQAYFLAWRIWQKMLYQNTTVEFDATQEADLLVRNDRILVADGTRPYTQDGEVTAVDGLELTLSQTVDFTVYASYVIFLQHIDGIAESIDITAGSASNKVVLADAPRLALVTDIEKYARTAYVIVGNTEPAQTAFLVTDREPQSNMTSTVKAKNYDARYYAHDLDFVNELIDENGYGPTGGWVPGTGTGYPPPEADFIFTAGTISGLTETAGYQSGIGELVSGNFAGYTIQRIADINDLTDGERFELVLIGDFTAENFNFSLQLAAGGGFDIAYDSADAEFILGDGIGTWRWEALAGFETGVTYLGFVQAQVVGGTVVFTAAPIDGAGGAIPAGLLTYTAYDFIGSPTVSSPSGTLISGDIAGFASVAVATYGGSGDEMVIGLRVPNAGVRANPQTAYWTSVSIAGVTASRSALSADEFATDTTSEPGYTHFKWRFTPFFPAPPITTMSDGVSYTAVFLWGAPPVLIAEENELQECELTWTAAVFESGTTVASYEIYRISGGSVVGSVWADLTLYDTVDGSTLNYTDVGTDTLTIHYAYGIRAIGVDASVSDSNVAFTQQPS